jgi:hypothetical protein
MDNRLKINTIFWLHFLVAAASHVFVVLIIGGVLKLLGEGLIVGYYFLHGNVCRQSCHQL